MKKFNLISSQDNLKESFDKSKLYEFTNKKVKIGQIDSSSSDTSMDESFLNFTYLMHKKKNIESKKIILKSEKIDTGDLFDSQNDKFNNKEYN